MQSQLDIENAQAVRTLQTLEVQHSDLTKKTEGIAAKATVLDALRQQLERTESDRTFFIQELATVRKLQDEVDATSRRQQHHTELAEQVSAISRELNVPERPFGRDQIAALLLHVQAEAKALRESEIKAGEFLTALVAAEKTASELDGVKDRLKSAEERRRSLDASWQRVEECIRQARMLSAAAVNTKKVLLTDVFDGTLNSLWRDLFRRLVKADRFTPQLKLVQKGRRLTTEIQGHAEAVNPFEHASSVLSAGNSNTAALSLFLTVHLLEEPRHKLLVLDDPVQNIDDVHVVQVASLLRTIVNESRRQIIVGVHERSLFDYLCLELGPTNENQALIAIELQNGADGQGTEITVSRKRWEKDKLEIGA